MDGPAVAKGRRFAAGVRNFSEEIGARDGSMWVRASSGDCMELLGERLARGEESAFAALYDACANRLHRYAAARLGSADAASDVVQSAFLRAVRSRRRFASVENPEAYLFEIARNEIARRATRDATRRETPLPAEEQLCAAADSSAEDAEIAAAALAKLNAGDREVVELKVFCGLTFTEIGALLGQPAATTATRYRRALASLRGWLERQLR